jgi:hypothetical protein
VMRPNRYVKGFRRSHSRLCPQSRRCSRLGCLSSSYRTAPVGGEHESEACRHPAPGGAAIYSLRAWVIVTMPHIRQFADSSEEKGDMNEIGQPAYENPKIS